MSKLFIYFSLSGNGDVVADALAAKGYEVRKVVQKRGIKKPNFFGILSGGFQAGMGIKAKLLPYNTSLEGVDEVIVGSPIWNGRFSSPINRVLADMDFHNVKLSFVFYSGSGEAKKVSKTLTKLYPDAPYLCMKEPKSHPEELKKLDIYDK